MRLPKIVALLATLTVAVGAMSLGGAGALAQDAAKKPSTAAVQKKAPGKVCSDLAPNSPAHKDCIAKQAKADKAAKEKKAKAMKPEKAPKRS
jgi:hypothetical protein